jgi:SET domain-containing protein
MQSKLKRKNIYVKQSAKRGYGVFADEDIDANEVIEEAYTLTRKTFDKAFTNYYFRSKKIDHYLLPLGYGSIFNHSNHPNADFEFDSENLVMVFYALRPIKKGDEIFIFYNFGWFQDRRMKIIEPFKYRIRSLKYLFYFLLRFLVVFAALIAFIYFTKQ